MSFAQEQLYTLEDIYSLPDNTRAELVDGHIYYMAPPSRKHQRLLLSLSRAIAAYIDQKGGNCEIDIAPFAVFLNQDAKNYVEPDICVICDNNKLTDNGCVGAPDWIIEIVSPSSHRMDYYTKLFKYRTAGVREYWIVDPDKNRILVYNFEQENVEEHSFHDIIKAGIYDDCFIDFSKLSFQL